MTKKIVLACTLGLALALGAPAGSARAASTDATLSAAKKKHRVHHPRRPAGKIACTPAGCHRIPPGCYPTPGMDFWGNPTGFDRIICPR
jgi:hypothetical protein